MCVIAVLPKHIALSQKILKNCYENNPDGFGIMALVDGKMQIAKSMGNFDVFLTEYRNFPQNVERALHFRWATHGALDEKNCHPFPVTPDLWLMHNGVINTCEVDDTFSDTWNFATHDLGREEIIKSWGMDAIERPDFKAMLEKISAGSKLFFMDTQGRTLRTFEKDWHKERGCFFSNKHSLESKKTYYAGSYKGAGSYGGYYGAGWGDDEGYYGGDRYANATGRTSDFLGKAADESTQYSDLVPYGRTIEGAEGQHWLGKQPDDPMIDDNDAELTIAELYDMSGEDVADWVQDYPWAATDLILELIGRERTMPLFDKKTG